jgi:hypothetical protein
LGHGVKPANVRFGWLFFFLCGTRTNNPSSTRLPDGRLGLFSVRRLREAFPDSLLLPLLSADLEGACDSKPKAIERPRLPVRSVRKDVSSWQKTKSPA